MPARAGSKHSRASETSPGCATQVPSWPFFAFELPFVGSTLHGCVTTAYDQTGLLVPKLKKLEVAERYRHDLAARVIERYWHSEGRARLRRWHERNLVNPDYSDDRWVRRQLEAAVAKAMAASERASGVRASAPAVRIDYDEAMHQARLLIDTGTRGPVAVEKAAEAVLAVAVANDDGRTQQRKQTSEVVVSA